MSLRILIWAIALILFFWVGGRWTERRMVFAPSSGWYEDLSVTSRPAEERRIQSENGVELSAIWFPSPWPKGVLLYCHGNAGNLSHRRHVVETWRDKLGYSVLLFDYQGYGRSGGKTSEDALYADTLAAYHEAKELAGMEPVVAGRSLGTVPAIWLSARKPVRGLYLDSPLSSAEEMAKQLLPIPGIGFILSVRLDNLSEVKKISCPLFIVHGEQDRIIPLEQGQKVYDAAPGVKRFVEAKGQGHNEVRDTPELMERLKQFLENLPTEPAAGSH